MTLKGLVEDIEVLNGRTKFPLIFDFSGGFVEFYNTSGKPFVLGLKSIKQTFIDIKSNLNVFNLINHYEEKSWRDAGGAYFTDKAANAIATVQTKPFFATLSKFVSLAIKEINQYDDNHINLNVKQLDETIEFLSYFIDLFKVDISQEIPSAPPEDLNILERFANWFVNLQSHNYFNKDLGKTIEGLKNYQFVYEDFYNDDIFNIDLNNIENKIEILRDNIYDKSGKFWAYSQTVSNHQPKAILGDNNYIKFLKELLLSKNIQIESGYNKIYFGSPGTGKSYSISQLLDKIGEEFIERVTFHPDYDYASFIGGYKPITEGEGKDSVVNYKFVPQIFIKIYEKAHRDPYNNYYLIIEEINRGNCAEIFGDIFQLLDRNPKYNITPSEDLLNYLLLSDSKATTKSLINGKLSMPDNLILLATMNTSDQSLYPMDSAFKRRWDWEYVPIKYPLSENDKSCPSFKYIIQIDDNVGISWIQFISSINNHILDNPSLGLDKCIGNFFLKPKTGNVIGLEELIHKCIFYLWNDVFKEEDNEIFDGVSYMNFFPIKTNGLDQIKRMIEILKIKDFYSFDEESSSWIKNDESVSFNN